MGILGCGCSVALTVAGDIDIPVVGNVAYDLAIGVCPDCELAGSGVTGALTVTPLIGEPIEITLDLAATGLPVCGDGILTIDVFGNILGNDVTLTVTLDAINGQVCIGDLPIIGELCVDAVVDILDCTTP